MKAKANNMLPVQTRKNTPTPKLEFQSVNRYKHSLSILFDRVEIGTIDYDVVNRRWLCVISIHTTQDMVYQIVEKMSQLNAELEVHNA